MYLTGFCDEAGAGFDLQLAVTKQLGWKYIESRQIGEKNLATLNDAEFESVCRKLEESGIRINCYGSAIGNSSNSILDSPESSYEEMRAAIPRMKKLGIKMIRMMSFFIPPEERPSAMERYFPEVVRRVQCLVHLAEENDILCVHENCINFGGISYEHTLRLLEAVPSPNLKLVFDTGNPVFSDDVRGTAPYHKQDSWEFYRNVRKFIAYVHVKDAKMEKGKIVYTFPGEGDGQIVKIVEDLLKTGYDGGFSLEPHLLHGLSRELTPEERSKKMQELYIEACLHFEKNLKQLRRRIAGACCSK